jgi:hypothetical protein
MHYGHRGTDEGIQSSDFSFLQDIMGISESPKNWSLANGREDSQRDGADTRSTTGQSHKNTTSRIHD